MAQSVHSDLAETYGQAGLAALMTAYEQTLLAFSQGRIGVMPDPETRLLIVTELLREGRRSGFDAHTLTYAALAVLGRHDPDRSTIRAATTSYADSNASRVAWRLWRRAAGMGSLSEAT